ncbi:alpha/beta hydrolase fold domain-containing protein [Candidatus Odyssella acanthamoebae]|nr:alpha/beta hydrolase fold domain-containing protein [Candidatus Paracaedibacter acanthamoebae]
MAKKIKRPVAYLRFIDKTLMLWNRFIRLPAGFVVYKYCIQNVTVESVQLKNLSSDTKIIYVHGGAFIIGLNNIYRKFACLLSRKCQADVILIDYNLAPTSSFPRAMQQVLVVYQEILKTTPPSQIIIAGDSAGGNLAMAMLLLAKESSIPMPACAVILSGWLDLTLENAAKKAEDDLLITMKHLIEVRDSYLQYTVAPNHYLASPIYGNIKGLPPLFMHAGEEEILLNDTVSFVKKAESENIKVQFEIGQDMLHVHPILFPSDNCSLDVINKIATFISHNISSQKKAPLEGKIKS